MAYQVWYFTSHAFPVSLCMEPVMLSKQDTCSGYAGTVITCTTLGSELVWNINGYVVPFREHMAVGKFERRNGNYVILLRKIYNTTDTAAVVFLSALSIVESSSPDYFIRIGCHNGRTSTEKFLEYQHVEPSE